MDFNSSGTIKSPFSPRLRQSLAGRRVGGLGSAKKSHSKLVQQSEPQGGDVIYKTPLTTIQTYGPPLPVMVTEALTFGSGSVSVRLSDCGWCWVVCGRRCVAWARGELRPARDLTLPQTDLAHKADLVVVFYEEGAQVPSCIGVSPEGTVRYWPSVGQENVFVDVSAELAGQECEKLSEPTSEGLILATTTCTVVMLQPTVLEGRATVVCRTLRPPSGWLGGIGRRVSLLFFGSMPAHADTKLVGVVGLEDGSVCVVCGGPALQVWRAGEVHEHALRRLLLEAAARAHLAPHGDLNSLEVIALEVRADGGCGLLLLAAIVNVARSPEMRYALAYVCVEDATCPRVRSMRGVRWTRDEPPRCLPLPAPGAAPAPVLLYSAHALLIATGSGSSEKSEVIEVGCEGDQVLGAGSCEGRALVLSRRHGVLALLLRPPADTLTSCESPLGSPCPSDLFDGNLSLYEIDPHEMSLVSSDACGRLKTAFLFHVRREHAACGALLAELFPPRAAAAAAADVDAPLDRTVLRVAAEIIDDIPAGDPRWKVGGSGSNIPLGSSSALQVGAQLRDKQRALALFVEFLRAAGLWQRLGLVSREGGSGCVATSCALGALAERLAAAVALRRLQEQSDNQIIDAAIYQVVSEGEEEAEVQAALGAGALSPSDVCFRRVSRVGRVLLRLAHPPPAAPVLSATIDVLLSVLSEVHKCRAAWAAQTGGASGAGGGGAGAALLGALGALAARAARAGGAASAGGAALAGALLHEAAHALPAHQYRRLRTDTIRPFLEEGEVERAAALAETFGDLELLVELCHRSRDMDKLTHYLHKYSDEGMAEVCYAWMYERGGEAQARLVRARLAGGLGAGLAGWLRAAPPRHALLALLELAQRELPAAAALLLDLADRETQSIGRLTSMASLAKLCLVASGEDAGELAARAEARLQLSAQTRALPRDVRLLHALDAPDTRVVPPEELVQMYIECDSDALTEYDYKKALDLTDFIQDMEQRDELRLRVWCACAKRERWPAGEAGTSGGARGHQQHMFFRLAELVNLMGGDLELVLPPLEDVLTAPELAELVSDPQVHYLLKYGYECMDNMRSAHS